MAAANAGLAPGPPLGPPPSDGAALVDALQTNFPLRAFEQVKDLPATFVVAPATVHGPPNLAGVDAEAVADPAREIAPRRATAVSPPMIREAEEVIIFIGKE
jgi:hypothetical protein